MMVPMSRSTICSSTWFLSKRSIVIGTLETEHRCGQELGQREYVVSTFIIATVFIYIH